eukprot:366047-Chlamydomonas_euryale.AAC.6
MDTPAWAHGHTPAHGQTWTRQHGAWCTRMMDTHGVSHTICVPSLLSVTCPCLSILTPTPTPSGSEWKDGSGTNLSFCLLAGAGCPGAMACLLPGMPGRPMPGLGFRLACAAAWYPCAQHW